MENFCAAPLVLQTAVTQQDKNKHAKHVVPSLSTHVQQTWTGHTLQLHNAGAADWQ